MTYEKHPTFACGPCRKTFKNQRGLDAHNAAVHAEESVQEDRLADGVDLHSTDRGSNPVRDVDKATGVIVDEAAEIDPKWFDKL
jgi:hypothetical protein